MSQAQLLPTEHFSPSVSIIEGRPATTSLAIAKHFGKSHDKVSRDIRALCANCPKEFTAANFGVSEYTDSTGRQLPMFITYFDGFILLVMGYTGKRALQIKLVYIAKFNEMREQLERLGTQERARAMVNVIGLPGVAITPEQQAQLKAIVDAKVSMLPAEMQRKAYAEVWSRFSRHFQIARYQQLPSERIGEAITYLVEMRIEERKPLPQGKESKALSASGAIPIEFEPPCPVPVEDDISQAFKRARAVTEYLKALKLQIHVPCRVQTASLSFLNSLLE